MASVILNFVGGVPFQALYEVVKAAIKSSHRFKAELQDLEFALCCFRPEALREMDAISSRINLSIETVRDLEKKLIEGRAIVEKLSKLSCWNFWIISDCCGGSYAEKLNGITMSLQRLALMLGMDGLRHVMEIFELTRRSKDDELNKVLSIVENMAKQVNDVSMKLEKAKERANEIRALLAGLNGSSLGGGDGAALLVDFKNLIEAQGGEDFFNIFSQLLDKILKLEQNVKNEGPAAARGERKAKEGSSLCEIQVAFAVTPSSTFVKTEKGTVSRRKLKGKQNNGGSSLSLVDNRTSREVVNLCEMQVAAAACDFERQNVAKRPTARGRKSRGKENILPPALASSVISSY